MRNLGKKEKKRIIAWDRFWEPTESKLSEWIGNEASLHQSRRSHFPPSLLFLRMEYSRWIIHELIFEGLALEETSLTRWKDAPSRKPNRIVHEESKEEEADRCSAV